jgi:hypothetical protein
MRVYSRMDLVKDLSAKYGKLPYNEINAGRDSIFS